MTDQHETRDGKPNKNLPQPSSEKFPVGSSGSGFSSGPKYPNPLETTNPDPATLREQWRYATRQYSRWYSQAWGAAILAGLSFFALGWIIKGSTKLRLRNLEQILTRFRAKNVVISPQTQTYPTCRNFKPGEDMGESLVA